MQPVSIKQLQSKQRTIQFKAQLPLTLYIHLPWCVQKCPYCDFNSHQSSLNDVPEQAYLQALIRDLEQALPSIWGRRIQSIFIGGGTPSLFKPDSIAHLLTQVRTLLPMAADIEITMEANPGTVDAAYFADYRHAGINRLSLGIQSFNNEHLQQLGRIHDAWQAHQAIEVAQQCFSNINLDLMYALPQQEVRQAVDDVTTALACQPQHLSCYQLTIEPNTPFHATPPDTPDDDSCARMQSEIEQQLQNHGYEHYETSAFAKAGFRCQHNLNYWQFGDYLGIGAGAHSKLTFHNRIIRQMRHKSPKHYMQQAQQQHFIQQEKLLDCTELPLEFMMNALRLNQGIPNTLFEQRTSLPFSQILPQLERACEQGLLHRDHQWLRPTEKGRHFLNNLLELFM